MNVKLSLVIVFIIFNIFVLINSEGTITKTNYEWIKERGSKEAIIAGYYAPINYSINDDVGLKMGIIGLNQTRYSGEPAYKIIVQASSRYLNGGDYLVLDMYITGVGDVDFAKININIPSYLVENQSVDVITRNHYYDINPLAKPTDEKFNYYEQPIMILKNYNTTDIDTLVQLANFYPMIGPDNDTLYFANYGEVMNDEDLLKKGGMATYPTPWTYKLPEGTNKNFYLSKIIFKLQKNASPGDHNIKFNLFYKWKGKWYMDTESIPLHVNHLYEKPSVQYFIMGLAVLGILCQFDGVYKRHKKNGQK